MVVATKNDIFVYDGQQSVSITSGKIRNRIAEILASQYSPNTQIYAYEPLSQVWVLTASIGSDGKLTEAYILDMSTGTWGHKNFTNVYGLGAIKIRSSERFVWDDLGTPVVPAPTSGWVPGLPWDQQNKGTWDQQVFDSESSDLIAYEGNFGKTDFMVTAINRSKVNDGFGNFMYSMIERTGIPLEGSDGVVAITDVWFDLMSSTPLEVSICGMETLNSAPVWDGPYPVYEDNHLDVRVTGRYVGYKIETTDTPGYFRLNSMTVDWEHDGER